MMPQSSTGGESPRDVQANPETRGRGLSPPAPLAFRFAFPDPASGKGVPVSRRGAVALFARLGLVLCQRRASSHHDYTLLEQRCNAGDGQQVNAWGATKYSAKKAQRGRFWTRAGSLLCKLVPPWTRQRGRLRWPCGA